MSRSERSIHKSPGGAAGGRPQRFWMDFKSKAPDICAGAFDSLAYALIGPFSGTKNRFAFVNVLGSSVQKLFFDTFCQTRLGR
ncbi:MAG: hypothetical protein BWY52_00299 [Chloroflexi bacterium ADurb.Bin325]|nr:MAG: hypothetical protein BWY52_00299 [Chloroflexi bacterium ADurb.Bin325]